MSILKHNELVKSYIMPLCVTVTENNLSIISKGYDLVIWKSKSSLFRHSGESRARSEALALSSLSNKFWMPDQVRHDDFETFYEIVMI